MPASPRPALDDALGRDLGEIEAAGLWRELREIESAQGPSVLLRGREVLLFCSNNYLGLANHPAVVEASREAAARYGASAGSSRLISGHMRAHRELEERIAGWKQLEAALVFSTGYQANLGCITALAGVDDVVLSDELNHASIIDATRLSKARARIFRHNDTGQLEDLLREARGARRVLVVTESIFSMDGDAAPLVEMARLARRHGAWLMVDEAHGAGVFGKQGAGLVEELGLNDVVDVQVGTLGKALGSFGAYVAGSRRLVDLLINRARPFIFTTGLPPSAVAAAGAAIEICQREPERAAGLRRRVRELAAHLRAAGLSVPEAQSQILPVMLGDADRTLAAMHALLERGVYVAAIRPPTVPPGTSRLRLSVMATHTKEQLEHAADALARSIA
ncbi:MAG: 8-amino-7-oxononanoate synthase [Myxococcota bacterium]|nr:8-amino-7-oxononanoate synthase [Myxococcota bacterium]